MGRDESERLTLDPDEGVVWSGRPRVRGVLAGLAVMWTVVAGIGALAASAFGAGALVSPQAAVLGLVLVAGSVSAYVGARNTRYVLTDRTVYRESGVLSRSVERVDLERVQNTELSKGVLGTRFGHGSIEISTAGGGSDLRIGNVNDPDAVREELTTLVGAARDGSLGRTAGGRDDPAPNLDREAVAAAIEESRALRETAERVAGLVTEVRRS